MEKYSILYIQFKGKKIDHNYFLFPKMASTKNTSKLPSRKLLGENGVTRELLGDFQPEGSRGQLFLERYFDKQHFQVQELKALASIFSRLCNVPFPRDYTRTKALLIKWFDMNIDIFEQHRDEVFIQYGY